MHFYGDKGIDYCMEMFKSKYPMKIDDSDLVHAVLVSKFCENDLNNPNANPNSAGAFCVYKVVTFKNKKNLLKVKLEKIFTYCP